MSIHGMRHTRFYNIWTLMKARCSNPNSKWYPYYGGRGIKIEWESFVDFKRDMYESYLLHSASFGESNTTIERKNVNGNYNSENCRWATWNEQANNKQTTLKVTIDGEKMSLKQALRTKPHSVSYRQAVRLFHQGLSLKEILIYELRPKSTN